MDIELDNIAQLKANLDELHVLLHSGQLIPWSLIKEIICGASELLKFICDLIPSLNMKEES